MRKSNRKLNLCRETVFALDRERIEAGGSGLICVTLGCATQILTCRSAQNCDTVVFPCVTQTGCLG